jgi:hypothetical protein
VQILDIENKPNTVEINGQGEQMIDLGDAYDDIVITMGAGYITSRMESMEGMLKFLQVTPAVAPIISDLIAENSDWPSSQKIAERIRSQMDPSLLEAGGGDIEKITAKAQQMAKQLQQSQQMIEQLQMALEQTNEVASDNNVKIQLEQMKGQQQLILQELKNQNEIQKEMIRGDVAIQKQQMVNDLQMPNVGDEVEGYTYKGGDPSDQFNWEPVNG